MPRFTDKARAEVAARLARDQPLPPAQRTIAAAAVRQHIDMDALLTLLDDRLARLAADHPATECEITILRSRIAEAQSGVD